MQNNNLSLSIKARDLLESARFNPKFFYFINKASKIFKSKNFEKVVNFSDKEFFEKISDGIHSTVNLLEKGKVRYLYVHNLKEGFVDCVDKLYLDEKDHELNKTKELKNGVILLSVVGTIGNSALFSEYVGEKCSLPRNIAYIETNKKLDHHYVAIFFLSNFAREQAVMNAGGNIQGLLSLGKIKKMKIPILKKNLSGPLIDMYKKSIKLESDALKLLNSAKENFYKELKIDFEKINEKMSFNIDNKKFHKLDLWTPQFSNPYYKKIKSELEKKHKLVEIRTLKNKIIKFKEPGSEFYLNNLEKNDKDIPFIRTSDYFNYELDPNPDYFIEESSGKEFLKELRDGDLVITKDGKIGNIAIIFKTQKYILSAGSIILRLKKDINPFYIFLCISSGYIGQNFLKQRTVVASTIPHLKISRFEDIQIPLLNKSKMDNLGSFVKKAYELKSKRRILMLELKTKINKYFNY